MLDELHFNITKTQQEWNIKQIGTMALEEFYKWER